MDARDHLQQAKDVLQKEKDEEMRDMAKMEIDQLEPKIDQLESDLKELLIPKDPSGTIKMLCSKSGRERVAMKPPFSQATFGGCINVFVELKK